MPSPTDFGPPANEAETAQLLSALGTSFGVPAADMPKWLGRIGLENTRVIREGGQVAGGLGIVPMGQFFGGRSVPTGGISVVGVPPEQRGRGVALRLMAATLRELRERGLALSTLYPAAQELYRRAGYEQAGGRFEIRIAPRDIDVRERSYEVRGIRHEDVDVVAELYRRQAAQSPGYLDRGEFIWRRVREPREGPARGYLLSRGGRPEAYVYYWQKLLGGGCYELHLTDVAATTTDSARAMLSFLADHRSMAPQAIWHGGSIEPMLTLLPEQRYQIKALLFWMLRIVDVAKALAARGYPAGVEAQLRLVVSDEVLPDNAGAYRLQVAEGRATVEREDHPSSDAGALQITIRGLAMLFSGFLPPSDIVAAGLLASPSDAATQRAMETAATLFAGPSPCMRDMF